MAFKVVGLTDPRLKVSKATKLTWRQPSLPPRQGKKEGVGTAVCVGCCLTEDSARIYFCARVDDVCYSSLTDVLNGCVERVDGD